MKEMWQGFRPGKWQTKIDVRDFIQKNYKPYEGAADFLASATENTTAVWDECKRLLAEERQKGGVLDVDTEKVSTTISHAPGYIDKEHESIVGLQLDAPLKRGLIVNGGLRMAQQAAAEYGYIFYRKLPEHFLRSVFCHILIAVVKYIIGYIVKDVYGSAMHVKADIIAVEFIFMYHFILPFSFWAVQDHVRCYLQEKERRFVRS